MNVKNKKYSELPRSAGGKWLLYGVLLLALTIGFASVATAAVVEITAKFNPSPLNPSLNTFVNTTPQSGHCFSYPSDCANGSVSIATGIWLTNRTYDGSSADRRLQNYIGGNSSFRDVDVKGEDGSSTSLKFRINLLSQKVGGLSVGFPRPFQTAFGQNSNINLGACIHSGVGRTSDDWYQNTHVLPNQANLACYSNVEKNTKFNAANVGEISIGYALITPNPLLLKNGVYKGSVEYSLGKNLDLDLGEATYPGEPLVINFTLTVQHQFAVFFPPGSDKAILEPVGGWTNFLSSNRAPVPLRRELPFNLTSSGLFTMHVKCQYLSQDLCELKAAGLSESPQFDVSVMMPGVSEIRNGTALLPGARTSLYAWSNDKITFGSSAFAKNRASRLIIEMTAADAQPVFNYPGYTFSGNVTLVIDSAL